MSFELKFGESSKVQIQLEFNSIFFWSWKFEEIWTIGILLHLDGTSTHEVEFDTLIYEFHRII
jgi:hypothetical protein